MRRWEDGKMGADKKIKNKNGLSIDRQDIMV